MDNLPSAKYEPYDEKKHGAWKDPVTPKYEPYDPKKHGKWGGSSNLPTAQDQGYLADMGDKFQQGLYGTAGATLTGARGIFTDTQKPWDIEQSMYEGADAQRETLSQAQQEADATMGIDPEDKMSFRGVTGLISQAGGSLAPSMLPSGALAKGLQVAGKFAGAVGKGAKTQTALGAAGYAGGGALQIGGAAKNQIESEMGNMSQEQVSALEGYKAYYDKFDTPEQAIAQYKYDKSQEALGYGSALGALSMGAIGPMMERVLLGQMGKGTIKNILAGATLEAGQEAVEEGGQTRITNPLLGKPDWEGVAESATLGAIGGAGAGGIGGAVGAIFSPRDPRDIPVEDDKGNIVAYKDWQNGEQYSGIQVDNTGLPRSPVDQNMQQVGLPSPTEMGHAPISVPGKTFGGVGFEQQLPPSTVANPTDNKIVPDTGTLSDAVNKMAGRQDDTPLNITNEGLPTTGALDSDLNFYQNQEGNWIDKRSEEPVRLINQREKDLDSRRKRPVATPTIEGEVMGGELATQTPALEIDAIEGEFTQLSNNELEITQALEQGQINSQEANNAFLGIEQRRNELQEYYQRMSAQAELDQRAAAEPVRKTIGKNEKGELIYEDEAGTRSLTQAEHTGGERFNEMEGYRGDRFQTQGEIQAGKVSPEVKKQPVEAGDFKKTDVNKVSVPQSKEEVKKIAGVSQIQQSKNEKRKLVKSSTKMVDDYTFDEVIKDIDAQIAKAPEVVEGINEKYNKVEFKIGGTTVRALANKKSLTALKNKLVKNKSTFTKPIRDKRPKPPSTIYSATGDINHKLTPVSKDPVKTLSEMVDNDERENAYNFSKSINKPLIYVKSDKTGDIDALVPLGKPYDIIPGFEVVVTKRDGKFGITHTKSGQTLGNVGHKSASMAKKAAVESLKKVDPKVRDKIIADAKDNQAEWEVEFVKKHVIPITEEEVITPDKPVKQVKTTPIEQKPGSTVDGVEELDLSIENNLNYFTFDVIDQFMVDIGRALGHSRGGLLYNQLRSVYGRIRNKLIGDSIATNPMNKNELISFLETERDRDNIGFEQLLKNMINNKDKIKFKETKPVEVKTTEEVIDKPIAKVEPTTKPIYKPEKKDEKQIKESKSMRWNSSSILGNKISKDFEDQGKTRLLGKEVTSPLDLAILAQVYRNPMYETLRYFVTNDAGKIVYHTGITSRLAGETNTIVGDTDTFIKDFTTKAKKVGGKYIYLLHNHPSGNSKPSNPDIKSTRNMSNRFEKHGLTVQSHVIINHAEFSFIDEYGLSHSNILMSKKDARLYDTKPSVPHPILGNTITSPEALIKIAKQLEGNEDYIVIVGRGGAKGVVGFIGEFTPLQLKGVKGLALLRKVARDSGSSSLFAVNVPENLSKLAIKAIKNNLIEDALIKKENSLTSLRLSESIEPDKSYSLGTKREDARITLNEPLGNKYSSEVTINKGDTQPSKTIEQFSKQLEKDLNLTSLNLFITNKNDLKLDTIIVNKSERKEGKGTEALKRIVQYADDNNLRVVLSPAVKDDYQGTTSRSRLVKFYKRFGFKENKGRNKDFTLSESMFRPVPDNVKFSKTSESPNGSTVAELAQSIGKTTDKVTIVQSQADLVSMEVITEAENTGIINGMYNPPTGMMYLVADNISIDQGKNILNHEVVHGILRHSPAYKDALAVLERTKGSKAYREAEAAVKAAGTKDADVQEEILAYYIQHHPTMSAIKRLIAEIRRIVRKYFGGKMNMDDIHTMVADMAKGDVRGEYILSDGRVMFSMGGVKAKQANKLDLGHAVFLEEEGLSKKEIWEQSEWLKSISDKPIESAKFSKSQPGEPSAPTNNWFQRDAKPPLTDDEILNRQIREENKTLWDKAKQELKRNLTAGGLLPESVQELRVTRDGKMGAVEIDIGQLVRNLEKSVGKPFDNLSDKEQQDINDALTGNIPKGMTNNIKKSVMAMRQYIDSLSKDYSEILFDEVKSLQADNKNEAAAARAGLLETIAKNMGEYVHRSYKAFDDPKWPNKVPSEILNNAREYLREQYQGQIDTLEEKADKTSEAGLKLREKSFDPKFFGNASFNQKEKLSEQIKKKEEIVQRYNDKANDIAENMDRRTEATLNTILKDGTAYDNIEAFIRESKLGAKDLSILKRRKEIAPEILALLGQYTDPRINFTKSATKMSRLVFNQRFLNKVKEAGMGNFLFTEKDRPADAHERIKESESYSPLAGLYTYPEVDQAFRDALGKENLPDWYRTIVQINGMVKYGKTVLSPTTAARNWMSGFFFSMANGHFNYMKHMKKSLENIRGYFKHEGDLSYLRELKELGVVYDTPYAGEMMKLLEDSKIEDKYLSGNIKIKETMAYFTKFYQYGDDFWKIIGFENEIDMLMKHKKLTREQAKPLAAKRIRDTYPTYSMTGRWIQKLRRFPLAGTFVSFPAEIIRTTFNMLHLLQQDMKDPQLKGLARQRMAGLAIASGFSYAMQGMAMSMLGIDDDEEEAIRNLAAPWNKNSNIMPIGRDEDGNIRFIDLSFLDPYNYFKRPINALMRNQPIDTMIKESAREMLTPFFGTDITFGAISDIWHNKKDTGGTVFNPAEGSLENGQDIANHLRKNVQPGVVSLLERTFKALSGTKSPSGKVYNLPDEMMGAIGWRITTFDPKEAIRYKTYEFADKLIDSHKIVSRVIRSPNKVNDSELASSYKSTIIAHKRAYNDMITLVNAARKSELSNREIGIMLKAGRVSRLNIRHLLRGTIPIWKPSKSMVKGTADIEMKRNIANRIRLINSLP